MDQILLIDKPSGITSFDVIRKLRTKLGVRKMGHAGTLDPLATGLLIIATGKETKKISNYMGMSKEYEAVIECGKISTTYDADGKITDYVSQDEQGVEKISREQFEAALKKFVGEIQQRPPAFSAIKVKGERAYDLARKGVVVELPPRTVHMYALEIIEWQWPIVKLRIKCGKGTYIRSLAHDLGVELGCGAYVKELRRTKIGEFLVEHAQHLSP